MSLGDEIKRYRKHLRLTRKALGELVGISDVAIWKIETGRSSPRYDTLCSISRGLGVPVELLVKAGGDDEDV